MKKAFRFLALTVCLPFVVFSCDKEVDIIEDNNEEEVVEAPSVQFETRTFTCTIDEPDTKVSITPTDDGGGYYGKTTWSLHDHIMVHGEYINKAGYSVDVELDGVTNTISADGKTAHITITLGDGSVAGTVKPYVHTSGDPATKDCISTLYAAYPYSAVSSSTTHCYYDLGFTNTNAPLMLAYDDGAGNFIFKNVGAVISFIVPYGETFDSYEFYGNNGEIVGFGMLATRMWLQDDGASGTEEFEVRALSGETCNNFKTASPLTTLTGPVTCDGSTVHYIGIPVRVKYGTEYPLSLAGGFTIVFKNGGTPVKYITNSSNVTLHRNDFLPIGNVSSMLRAYTDHVADTGYSTATDLSTAGTANCYKLPKVGDLSAGAKYKFKAVKGNGNAPVGAIKSTDGVSVLWATYNDDAAGPSAVTDVIASVDYDKDYIYFTLPAEPKAGNAVIAAKNSSDVILWSWHIWIPATDVEDIDEGFVASGKKIMDRNLGAIYKAATGAVPAKNTYGLYYQWGRKDPFFSKEKLFEKIVWVYLVEKLIRVV